MTAAQIGKLPPFSLPRSGLSCEQRRAEGQSLCGLVPREPYAEWKPPKTRQDLLRTLQGGTRDGNFTSFRCGRAAWLHRPSAFCEDQPASWELIFSRLPSPALRPAAQSCRGRARRGDPARLAGCRGNSAVLDETLSEWAELYGDQTKGDHDAPARRFAEEK